MTNMSRHEKTPHKELPQIENGLDFSELDLYELSISEKKTCAPKEICGLIAGVEQHWADDAIILDKVYIQVLQSE